MGEGYLIKLNRRWKSRQSEKGGRERTEIETEVDYGTVLYTARTDFRYRGSRNATPPNSSNSAFVLDLCSLSFFFRFVVVEEES